MGEKGWKGCFGGIMVCLGGEKGCRGYNGCLVCKRGALGFERGERGVGV